MSTYAKRHMMFSKDEMVCTRTLYNMVWAGLLPITPTELPDALKRKTKSPKDRQNKKHYGTSISERPEISGLRMVASDKGRVIAAGWSGKVTTASTMVCIILMFLPIGELFNAICVGVIVATTIYSGVEYFLKNKDCLSDM